MSRRLLLALVLCGSAQAAAPPHVELTVTPAFKGWARPGRPTELDIRVGSDAPTAALLELRAGRQAVQANLDLQPGRVQRLHLPAAAADAASVGVTLPAAAPGPTREVVIARSERPLLGVALATPEALELDGFHTLVLSADDLPRQAAAHAALDALVLDAATLAALDPPQLAALLGHAALCGRVVVLQADARVRRVLDGGGACAGRALMSADTPAEARARLEASLAARLPAPMSPGEAGALARPGHAAWNHVALALAVYGAVLALALMFSTALPLLLAVPALAALAALVLPQALQPASRLVVWSEGESGAPVARYQAWQQVSGVARGPVRVPIPPQLGSAARPCEPSQAMRFGFDAAQGRATFAEFETRLFRNVALCFSGSFPMARAFGVGAGPDGARTVHNAGTTAWPAGRLLTGGRAHELPAVGPGARALVKPAANPLPDDAVQRTALARTGSEGTAALWALELGGVAALPAGAQGWLLVTEAVR